MMNGLQSLPQWQNDFNYLGSSMLGLLNAIQSIGALVGLPFSTYVADGFGRRFYVLFGASIMVRLTSAKKAIHGLSLRPSKPPHKVSACSFGAHFLIGFCLPFASSGAAMLITELSYPSYRTPGNRKRLTIIVALAWFAAWSGNGLVSYYLNEVFKTIGITDSLPNSSSTVYVRFVTWHGLQLLPRLSNASDDGVWGK